MNKKPPLTLGIILGILIFSAGAANEVSAFEIGGNVLENVAGTEFQLLPGQSAFPNAPPAYYLKIIEGTGLRLSPTDVLGTPNVSPNNVARFGIGKDPTTELDVLGTIAGNILQLFDSGTGLGQIQFDGTKFQWRPGSSGGWNEFGGSITGGTCGSGFVTAISATGAVTCVQESDPNVSAWAKTTSTLPTCQTGEVAKANGTSGFTCVQDATADADADASNEIQTLSTGANLFTLDKGGGTVNLGTLLSSWDQTASDDVTNITAASGLPVTVSTSGASRAIGFLACAASENGYVLKWNQTNTTWGCAADSDSDVWTAIGGGIKYTDNVGIGVTAFDTGAKLTVGGLTSTNSLSVGGDALVGGKVGVNIVANEPGLTTSEFSSSAALLQVNGSGYFENDLGVGDSLSTAGDINVTGGNISANASVTSAWKYVYTVGGNAAGQLTPRCTFGVGWSVGCDTTIPDFQCNTADGVVITGDPSLAPSVCYDWGTADSVPISRQFTKQQASKVGGWVSGTSGYPGDNISIGGDSAGDDLEIKINASATRNKISFTNQTGNLADIRAKKGFFESLFVTKGINADATVTDAGKVLTLVDETGDAEWRPSQSGADNWGSQNVFINSTLTGNGDETALGVDTTTEATRISENATVAGHTASIATNASNITTLGTTVTGHTTAIAGKQDTLTSSNNGTGISISGGLISIAPAFLGSVRYQSTWKALDNTSPTLGNNTSDFSATDTTKQGFKGNYYVVTETPAATTRFGLSWKNGDYIISNGAAWQKIDNTDVQAAITAASIDALSDVTISSPSTNQVLQYVGSVWTNQTANFSPWINAGNYADSANNRHIKFTDGNVGIGTASPASPLDVTGSILGGSIGTAGNALFLGSVGAGGGKTYGATPYSLNVDGNAVVTDRTSVGSELVSNGGFSGTGSWTGFGSGWNNASNNADHVSSNATALSQTIASLEAGKPYLIIFTVSGRTAGSVTPQLGGSSGAAVDYNLTAVTQTIIPGTAGGAIAFSPTTDFRGSVDTVSVKKIIGGNVYAVGSIRADGGYSIAGTPVINSSGAWVGPSTGLVGADGAKWWSAAADPNLTGGGPAGSVIGDFYLKSNGQIYKKTTAGTGTNTWTSQTTNIMGPAGAPGAASLVATAVATSAEATGAGCSAGATKITAGLDDGTPSGTANNGTLESGEITQTGYICNGAAGTNGTNGTNGATWLTGTADPNTTDPGGSVVGDFYLRTGTTGGGDVFKKTSTTGTKWTFQTNITGPLVAGTANQTLRRNATTWEATSALKVDSSGNVDIAATGSFSAAGVRKMQTTRVITAPAIGSFANIGSIARIVNLPVYAKIKIWTHHGSALMFNEYEVSEVSYAGVTTDWVEIPPTSVKSWANDGRKVITVDARHATNGGTLELRLRRTEESVGEGTVTVEMETNGTFTADNTQGTGATVATGYLGQNGWFFPTTVNRFMATTEGLFIKPNGNVGIGTASPGAKLDVSGGNIRATGEIIGTLGSGQGQLRMVPPDSSKSGSFLRNDGSDTYLLLTDVGTVYGGWNTLRPFYVNNISGNVGIGGGALYAQHAGNVGIGTASPGARLEVKGDTGQLVTGVARLSQSGAEKVLSASGLGGAFKVGDAVKVMRNGITNTHITTIFAKDTDTITLTAAIPLAMRASGAYDPDAYSVYKDPDLFVIKGGEPSAAARVIVDKSGTLQATNLVGTAAVTAKSTGGGLLGFTAPSSVSSNLIWTLPAANPVSLNDVLGIIDIPNSGSAVLGWKSVNVTSSVNALRSNAGLGVADGTARTQANHGAYPTTAPYGLASLDVNQKILVSELPDVVVGSTRYVGMWDANTNAVTVPSVGTLPTPDPHPTTGNVGKYYVVSVGGAGKTYTNVQSPTNWNIGDYVISNGIIWQKIDNTNLDKAIENNATVAGKQTGHAALTSIAGLTEIVDGTIYTTANNTYAVTGLTSFGRSLIDDADASAARSTLGLGALATKGTASLTADVSGILPLASGGTGVSLLAGADGQVLGYTGATFGWVSAESSQSIRPYDEVDAAGLALLPASNFSGITFPCTLSNNEFTCTTNNTDPNFNTGLTFDAGKYKYIEIVYKAGDNFTVTAPYEGRINQNSITSGTPGNSNFIINPDRKWHTVIVDITDVDTSGNNPERAWRTGYNTGISIDFPDTAVSGQVFTIGYIAVGNLGSGLNNVYAKGGNVGIGTPSPNARLDITAPSLGTNLNDVVEMQRIRSDSNNASFLDIRNIRTADATTVNNWSSAGTRIQKKVDNTWQGYMQFNGTGNDYGISFGTGGTTAAPGNVPERMRITSAGAVGIGTADPKALLSVESDALLANPAEILRFTRKNTSSIYPNTWSLGADGGLTMNNNNYDTFILKGGNVGINAKSPSAALTVAGKAENKKNGRLVDVLKSGYPMRFLMPTIDTGDPNSFRVGDVLRGDVVGGGNTPTGYTGYIEGTVFKIEHVDGSTDSIVLQDGFTSISGGTVTSSMVFDVEVTRNSNLFLVRDGAATPNVALTINKLGNAIFDNNVGVLGTTIFGGNVGIGTPAPNTKLQIDTGGIGIGGVGAINTAYGNSLQIQTDTTNFGGVHDKHTGVLIGAGLMNGWGTAKLVIRTSNSWGTYDPNPAMVVGASGVGIGGAADGKLSVHVPANSRGIESLTTTAGNTHLPWSDNWNYISGNGVIFRNAGNQEKMRIDATTGNVGIGTTNPQVKLDVNGALKLKNYDYSSSFGIDDSRYNSGAPACTTITIGTLIVGTNDNGETNLFLCASNGQYKIVMAITRADSINTSSEGEEDTGAADTAAGAAAEESAAADTDSEF